MCSDAFFRLVYGGAREKRSNGVGDVCFFPDARQVAWPALLTVTVNTFNKGQSRTNAFLRYVAQGRESRIKQFLEGLESYI